VILSAAKAARVENEIARRGGLGHKRFGAELIGPCPQCGGRDRFAVNIRKQVFQCRGCGRTGDVIAMVQHIDGCDFRTAVRTLGGIDDVKPVVPVKSAPHLVERDDSKNTERALSIWEESEPVAGTVAEEYLRRRGLEPPESDEAVRFLWACPFGDTRYPSLIALFRDVSTNEPRAVHRFALGPGGILVGKKMLGPVGGCAVKLDSEENVERGLTIAEGVETAIAARMKGLRPCWATGSAGGIRNFPLLAGVECLTLVVDNDHHDARGRQAGQEAAAECWRRWKDAGREVLAFSTNKPGTDVADIFKRGQP
jgi:putative DNA primase/helicase